MRLHILISQSDCSFLKYAQRNVAKPLNGKINRRCQEWFFYDHLFNSSFCQFFSKISLTAAFSLSPHSNINVSLAFSLSRPPPHNTRQSIQSTRCRAGRDGPDRDWPAAGARVAAGFLLQEGWWHGLGLREQLHGWALGPSCCSGRGSGPSCCSRRGLRGGV